MDNKEMNKEKERLELRICVDKQGIFKMNKWKEYFPIATEVANEIVIKLNESYKREDWIDVAKVVMQAMAENADLFKGTILRNMSYTMNLHSVCSEEIKMPHNEAKAYVKGHQDALNSFQKVFDNIQKYLQEILDKELPSR